MLLKSRKFVGQLVSEENILTFVTSPLRITSRKIRNTTTVFRLYCVINRISIFDNDDLVNEFSGWWGRMTEDISISALFAGSSYSMCSSHITSYPASIAR